MFMRVKTQYKLKTFAKVVFWHTIPPQIEPIGGFCLVGKNVIANSGAHITITEQNRTDYARPYTCITRVHMYLNRVLPRIPIHPSFPMDRCLALCSLTTVVFHVKLGIRYRASIIKLFMSFTNFFTAEKSIFIMK